MLDENSALFTEFEKVHDAYKLDEKLQQEFNVIGEKAKEVIQEWEKRLCSYSEKGNMGKYSTNLAEKFWQEVRGKFSHIDLVGCE